MNKVLSVATFLLLSVTAFAQDGEPGRGSSDFNALKNCYFGEQHLHTVNSPDAFAFGTRNTPDDAYKFARGEAIKKSTTGETIQKRTPYDWCAVTDHAEYLGMMPLLLDPKSVLSDTPIGRLMAEGKGEEAFQQIITSATIGEIIPYMADPGIQAIAWKGQIDAANRNYEPGKFTTLIAFEWSSQPNSANMHHNVFFRDDEGPQAVFNAFYSVKREDLWTYQEIQRSLGHENLSIPHNANADESPGDQEERLCVGPHRFDASGGGQGIADRVRARSPIHAGDGNAGLHQEEVLHRDRQGQLGGPQLPRQPESARAEGRGSGRVRGRAG